MSGQEFDYIIVGSGSAGGFLALRLSENPANRVLVLEAGSTDAHWTTRIPAGSRYTYSGGSRNWCFETEPEPHMNNRVLFQPRGKVLGGTSSLNGMVYVRGHRQDYQEWVDAGADGWGYDDVLPHFKAIERYSNGPDAWRGDKGPISVVKLKDNHPIENAFVEAGQQAGYPAPTDYNGEKQEGVGYFQLTTRNGRRCSAAVGYLNPIKSRPNLQIITHAHVQRLATEAKRVTGVVYKDKKGVECTVTANSEVIVSSGAIGSPQLLMLSGIGEAAQLEEHGIDVVADLPGVGKNLQDHLQARLVYKCNEPTLNDEVRSLFDQARIALKYLLFRAGPMTMAASLATGFLKTRRELETPDIQFHIQPWSADSPGEGVHPFSAFTMSVCQLRPESRGEIRLKKGDPSGYPTIHPNYLATETDRKTILEGVKIARKIATQKPLVSKIASSHSPKENIETDEELMEWVKDTATTIYHPTGTCKMGSDRMAVVDARLRVHGIEGLRIADCSIMPEIVSGNTNAPAIMIGEKASDLILEDRRSGS